MLLVLGFLMVCGIIFNSLTSDQDLRYDLRRSGVRVSGSIYDLRSARGGRNTAYMNFHTRDGIQVSTTYGDGMNFPERSKLYAGMSVDIVYDPFDPKRAIPAPLAEVPLRDVMAELLEFLRRIGLALLLVGPVIVGGAFYLQWRSRSGTNADNSLKPPPTT
jgi:hypothetical protein